MDIAIGLRAHTGWAIAISLATEGPVPVVVARRRLVLQAPGLPTEVYHIAHSLDPDAGPGLVAEAKTAAVDCARRELKLLCDATQGQVTAAGLVAGRRPPGEPPDHARLAHTGMHGAEGELYRWALLVAAQEAGLPVIATPERELTTLVRETLGLAPDGLDAMLTAMGKAVGPPWTAREKTAVMAGLVAAGVISG
jgi:hypothetical protein